MHPYIKYDDKNILASSNVFDTFTNLAMLLQKWPTFPGIALQCVDSSELGALFLIRAMDFIQNSGNVIK